jgi:hypothetical protein
VPHRAKSEPISRKAGAGFVVERMSAPTPEGAACHEVSSPALRSSRSEFQCLQEGSPRRERVCCLLTMVRWSWHRSPKLPAARRAIAMHRSRTRTEGRSRTERPGSSAPASGRPSAPVPQLLRVPDEQDTAYQMDYELSRLAREGLIERLDGKLQHVLTHYGRRVALFRPKRQTRAVCPGLQGSTCGPTHPPSTS